MFWLVESQEQFNEFKRCLGKEVFIEIIPYNPYIHPTQNSICAIYFRPLKDHKGYILPIFHTEVQENLFEDQVYSLIKQLDKIYCRDKKEFLHYFPLKQSIDITFPNQVEVKYTNAHEFIYEKYKNRIDVNILVPIVKHYEYCEALFEEIEHLIDKPVNQFYNVKASWVFCGIEKSGLHVDIDLYNQYFNEITESYVYTKYNFKTLTTRPSNNFNGVNYAALNKENGCREAFIPRNSTFIEFDISAYHPTLLAHTIGYDFGGEDIYSHFAQVYRCDRQEAKILTLQQLYGGVLPQYQNLEFFKKVISYIDDLWDTFQYNDSIECPISGHKFYRDKLDNMNPQKLLNYMIQNLETANNINLMWEFFKILKEKNTKLVLYTYDSFLFDVDSNEKDTIHSISRVFNEQKLNYTIKNGLSYNF
jgi:hypothetical protein